MSGLTDVEIQEINSKLDTLRQQIRETGATVLNPTPEWETLRKEIAGLNRKLTTDSNAKKKRAAASA
jgi:hypothetical protein